MNIDKRFYLIPIALLLLAVGILSMESCVASDEARAAHNDALVWKGEAQASKHLLDAIKHERDLRTAENEELARKVAELERRRIKPIPPAPKPPETDEELRQVLTVLGASPDLTVLTEGKTALLQPDAQLFAAWGQNSARVPAFEERVAADTQVIGAMKALETGLRTELRLCDETGKALSAQAGAHMQEALALRKENEGLVKVQVARTQRTKILLGVGLPVAAYLGFKLGRK